MIPPDRARVSLIGGKWTTFRGFAEEAADRVLGDLGRRRRTSTMLEPIGGGRDFPATADERGALLRRIAAAGVPAARAETLPDRYGWSHARCADEVSDVAPIAAMRHGMAAAFPRH